LVIATHGSGYVAGTTINAMNAPDHMHDSVTALIDAAEAFDRAAAAPGSHTAAPESLVSLQEALQVLSTAWYRLAADAIPQTRGGRLSREREVRLIGGLQDVGAAFARCARACREGEAAIAPVVGLDGAGNDGDRDGVSWFGSTPGTERAA
jgi:hypothetical protein